MRMRLAAAMAAATVLLGANAIASTQANFQVGASLLPAVQRGRLFTTELRGTAADPNIGQYNISGILVTTAVTAGKAPVFLTRGAVHLTNADGEEVAQIRIGCALPAVQSAADGSVRKVSYAAPFSLNGDGSVFTGDIGGGAFTFAVDVNAGGVPVTLEGALIGLLDQRTASDSFNLGNAGRFQPEVAFPGGIGVGAMLGDGGGFGIRFSGESHLFFMMGDGSVRKAPLLAGGLFLWVDHDGDTLEGMIDPVDPVAPAHDGDTLSYTSRFRTVGGTGKYSAGFCDGSVRVQLDGPGSALGRAGEFRMSVTGTFMH